MRAMRGRWPLLLLGVIALAMGALMLATCRASRPLFDETLEVAALVELEIAPADQALTFARRRAATGHEVLLIVDSRDGALTAVDLSAHFAGRPADPVELLQTVGYDAVRAAGETSTHRLRLPLSELDIPIDTGDRHVAAGANFAAHADEAGIGDPFVFPKRAAPTHSSAPVSLDGARRLDYEVELAFVPLRDIRSTSDTPGLMGLLLCNDFTDRWTLVRGMAGGGEMGTRGFADAKGREGFLPVGPFFVVPRDLESFYPTIELSLWVNGRLRQRATAAAMIWSPSEIIAQAFRRRDWSFDFGGQGTSLLTDGRLPARTLVLSGTPAGVIFRPVNVWWAPAYLDPGDEVISRATYLGLLRNHITR
jgi:2-keto-4-pentenoate hydratase/2-oxohepta-3-ene-1,7-dioic acid hydratase in catechol pathway